MTSRAKIVTALASGLGVLTALDPSGARAHEPVCSAGVPDGELTAIPPKAGARRPLDPALGFLRRASGSLAAREGALAGKAVYLSAGHGLYWAGASWNTQRDNLNGIIEDLVAVEAVNQYLIPYLHAMGAFVVAIRDPGMNPNQVIVDDGDAEVQGAPLEVASTEPGWGAVSLPIMSDDVRPFAAGGARALVAHAATRGGLVYAPEIPEPGHYTVTISFVAGDDRVPDAHYVVRHAGGETHFRVDQAHHGSTWVLLGEFYFEAGHDPRASAVIVLDDSSHEGAIVSSDAVRFGGGMGVHDRGGGASGRPMYEHGARYSTQWAGAPYEVFGDNTTESLDNYTARAAFAKWEHPAGEDAVYLSWHSNALESSDAGQGTSSYTYSSVVASPGTPGSTANFDGVAGSRELQDAVHAQIVDDLRAAWDPAWVDDGRYSADLAEVNDSPQHNDEFPAALFEVAYHDNPSQAAQLRDPTFRRLVARAMAQGIAQYFAQKDGTPLVLPPEPPQALWVRNDGDGGLEIGWRPPEERPGDGDPADGWVVQVSHGGYGFDDGTLVTGTSHVIDGLEPGDVRHVRVLGRNAGGLSLPSHTVSAGVAPSGNASVLVVGGFDRIDGALLVPDDASSFGQGVVDRMWLHRINDGTYAVRHAHAVSAAGFSFDGATDDAVEVGDVAIAGYQAVDWFCGEDSIDDDPLSPESRAALTDYLAANGRLLLSGSELAWALDLHGDADEQAFVRERLHARYELDDAETYDVLAAPGPLGEVLPLHFADPTSYDPRFPDVLGAAPGGVIALDYGGGLGSGAAIAWGVDGEADRGVLLGFPFEVVAGAPARADLMANVLAFFGVQERPGDDDSGDDTGGGEDDDDGGDSTTSPDPEGDATTDAGASSGDATSIGDPGNATLPWGCGCTGGRRAPGPSAALVVIALAFVRRRAFGPGGRTAPWRWSPCRSHRGAALGSTCPTPSAWSSSGSMASTSAASSSSSTGSSRSS